MTKNEFLKKLENIIETAKIGILATVDETGCPYTRWMTPGFIRERAGVLFALTSRDFRKIRHLEKNPRVQWQFQTRTLDQIINLRGLLTIIDNSALKTEVIEGIGSRLNVFWKLNDDPSSLLVLETIIESAEIFYPMKGEKESLVFGGST